MAANGGSRRGRSDAESPTAGGRQKPGLTRRSGRARSPAPLASATAVGAHGVAPSEKMLRRAVGAREGRGPQGFRGRAGGLSQEPSRPATEVEAGARDVLKVPGPMGAARPLPAWSARCRRPAVEAAVPRWTHATRQRPPAPAPRSPAEQRALPPGPPGASTARGRGGGSDGSGPSRPEASRKGPVAPEAAAHEPRSGEEAAVAGPTGAWGKRALRSSARPESQRRARRPRLRTRCAGLSGARGCWRRKPLRGDA